MSATTSLSSAASSAQAAAIAAITATMLSEPPPPGEVVNLIDPPSQRVKHSSISHLFGSYCSIRWLAFLRIFGTTKKFRYAVYFGFAADIAIYMYIIFSILRAAYNVTLHPLAKFRGPRLRAAFYFPELLSLARGTAVEEIKDLHDRYGDIVRVTPEALSFDTAQSWRVSRIHSDIYGLRDGRREVGRDEKWHLDHAGKSNIIVVNATDHSRMRRTLAHAFSDVALREQESLMTTYFEQLIEKLQEKIDGSAASYIDLRDWYNFFTFDIIGDLCLGEAFGTSKSGSYHYWIEQILVGLKFVVVIRFAQAYPLFRIILALLMNLIPGVEKQKQGHMAYTIDKLEARLRKNTDRKDFISYILGNNKNGMSRDEIEGTATVMIIAGSETTASALCGATYYMLKHPKVLLAATSEVRKKFKTVNDINMVSVRDLTYINTIIEEALRMYPPTPSTLPRRTRSEGEIINGTFIPGNISVGVNHWAAYHAAKNFADPDTFDPARWSTPPPDKYKHDDKTAFQPFSIGPRNCLGKNLPYFEMRSILARMLWNFDIELCKESR
ncbi:uncharacterized protein EAE98_003222 [Botrytis deweyae]|uniref:Cytochrome P450 n=1 Tax=Botrytis deweyae TaxID=2478750 RepID=A0ABQ7ISY0_9HELO|nr:uncharacterized protein EAE98_003222 [Botrytis deweyae]KAF7933513.1 hypothetical protein EAE98_003222 [Botrytis deweyae]